MCKLCEGTDDQHRERGKIFGYPDCCIEEFISDGKIMNNLDTDVRNDAQVFVARQTYGFVPCKKHAEMIVSGEISVDDIIVGRNIKQSRKLNKIAQHH